MPYYGSPSDVGGSQCYDQQEAIASDEREPLLGNDFERKADATPLPTEQLTVLCLLRVLDPLAFSQIFPYINNLIQDLHLTNDPSRVGLYSGLVESIFALSQLLAIYPWARASDIVGRRPVILLCVTGLALTTLLFGLSSSNFLEVMMSRALAGLFTGNVAVIPSVLCEITDASNQATAFPIFGLFWPIGSIIGPLIGGNLANPAKRYPEWFSHPIWKTYPYFLPCLIAAGVTAATAIFSYLFLKESLNTSTLTRERETLSDCCSTITTFSAPRSPMAPNTRQLLKKPIIRSLCISGFAMNFTTTAFDVVFVLCCYTPIALGGLSLTESQIGWSLSISGILAALLQLCVMPTLLRKYDHAKMYSFCMCIWPFAFLSLPLLNFVARATMMGPRNFQPDGQPAVWIGIVLTLSLARVGYLAHSLNMLLVKQYAPPSALASTNGLVQFAICLARAVSPAFVSSLFAISADRNLLGGRLWVVGMILISMGSARVSRNIVVS